MSGYLFDTNTALFGLAEPERIPAHVREAVEGKPVYLSVLSYWEVLLKSMKGNLQIGEPRTWWTDALDTLGATPLLLRPNHISARLLARLPRVSCMVRFGSPYLDRLSSPTPNPFYVTLDRIEGREDPCENMV